MGLLPDCLIDHSRQSRASLARALFHDLPVVQLVVLPESRLGDSRRDCTLTGGTRQSCPPGRYPSAARADLR